MASRPQSAEHGPIPPARHRAVVHRLGRGPGRALLVLGDTHPVETAPPPMPSYRPVTVAARLKLEEILARRWGRKHADSCLRALARWDGWRVPTEPEFLAAVPYLSRQARARKVRQAKDELADMRALPPFTGDDALLPLKVAFG